jgi:anti-sigma factor RsiW
MRCEQLLHVLNEYIEGEIAPAVCQELEKHLADCGACRIVVDTLRQTISLYKEDAVHELPADFQERLHQALRAKWRERTT